MIAGIRRVNRARRPESSIALRASVFGAVMIGTLAIAAQGAVSVSTATALALVFPCAYFVSYRRRAADNWHIKIALAVGALLALIRFFGQIGAITTLDEVRFPLADLFLWVQVLHSFDLPARKDLLFSLGSSVALMAIAGSISQDLGFATFLAAYFACAITALVLAHHSEVGDSVEAWMGPEPVMGATRRRSRWRDSAVAAAAVALASAVLFLVIPQPTSARTFALPFSVGSHAGASSAGGILNPGFSGSASARSNGSSYYGFSPSLDLRVRGDLSSDLVMRVRASAPALWKGMIFDGYDGTSWTGDRSAPTPLPGDPPYAYPSSFRSLGPRAEVTQTFYVEAEVPNAIFAAGQPDSVFFDGSVGIDQLGALRTDSTLAPGTVYSVVSTRGAATPAQLRSAAREQLAPEMARYLQLPGEIPARVGELARRITSGANNDYDRVQAIEAYLRAHYRYSIDSPVPPPGRDAVDHFLFDARVGFCEQFASATVVMLRTLGIPARLVAGYAVGHRNPFTGYYDVRASDAHTWVEVWFPQGLGWYEFDPTFDVPPARAGAANVLPIARVISSAATTLAALAPGARLAATGALAVAIASVALWATLALWRRRRGHAPARAGGSMGQAGAPGPVQRAFARLEAALAARGRGRVPSETARELMGRTVDLELAAARGALESFERESYGADLPSAQASRAAIAELDRLASTMSSGEARG